MRKWLWPLAFEFGRMVRLFPFHNCRFGVSDAAAISVINLCRLEGGIMYAIEEMKAGRFGD